MNKYVIRWRSPGRFTYYWSVTEEEWVNHLENASLFEEGDIPEYFHMDDLRVGDIIDSAKVEVGIKLIEPLPCLNCQKKGK